MKGTVSVCMRYRVTGLAAEGAFFAVLSLPPLVFGLAGSIGYVVGIFGDETVRGVKAQIVDLALQALTEESVQRVLVPTLDAVLDQGRADIISIGFVLALWSGSRALNVFIDTISIMYGMGGRRGIVKTRLLSFTMYVIVLAAGVVVVPLVLAGPTLVDRMLPENLNVLNTLYWPTVVLSTSLFLTTLYHLAVPVRTPWRHDMPGAVLALLLWIGGSYLLRFVLAASIGGTSIYGPLAAPIAVLLWLYLIVISLLVGAAFNASIDEWLGRRPGGNGYRPAESAASGPDTRSAPDQDAGGDVRRDGDTLDRRAQADDRRPAGAASAASPEASPPGGPPSRTEVPGTAATRTGGPGAGAAGLSQAQDGRPVKGTGATDADDRNDVRTAVTWYDQPLPFDEAVGEAVAGQPGVP